jgi:hypothetical protein
VTRDQLIAAWRLRVMDTAAPYLWGADEVLEYLNDAIEEACERADLIRDTVTAAICEVAITANTAGYDLDDRILEVLRAALDSEPPRGLLTLATTEGMDRDHRGAWFAENPGTPSTLVIDPQGAGWRATLVPPPSADTTLRLHVYRRPLAPIVAANDEPEIHERQHIKLLDWMDYRGYSKKDAETFDAEKAAAGAAAFTATFGPKRDARVNRAQHDMQFPVVRPSPL